MHREKSNYSTPSPLSPNHCSEGWQGLAGSRNVVFSSYRKELSSFRELAFNMANFFATHSLSLRDCVSPRSVRLVLFVLICSAFDALFTLIHVEQGGTEANPIMAMAMDFGPSQFVRAKMGLTGLGTILLACYERLWLGMICLYFTAMLYACILLYHAVLYFLRY